MIDDSQDATGVPTDLVNHEAMSQENQQPAVNNDPQLFDKPKPHDPTLFDSKPAVLPSPYSEEQQLTTSMLGAFAQNWSFDGTRSLNEMIAITNEKLTSGKETQLREEISDSAKADKVKALTELQIERLHQSGSETIPPIKDLLNRELTVRSAPHDYDALENEGIANMQARAAGDPHQAAAMAANPDGLTTARQAQQRAVTFNREYDIHAQELKQQGLPSDILDLLVMPFTSYYAQTAAAPGVSNLSELLPGANLSQIIDELHSFDVDNGDYGRALHNAWDKIKAHSGFLGTNQALALQVFSHLRPYANYADQQAVNFQMGLDAASLVPFAFAAKASKNPYSVLVNVGDREGASKAAATAIIKDANGMPDAAAGGLGKLTDPGSGAFETSLPSFVKPNTPDLVTPWTGIAGDVAKQITAFHEGTEEAIKSLQRGAAPLEQEQLQAKVAQAVQTAELRFARDGEDIVDIHNVMPEVKAGIAPLELKVDTTAANRLTKTGATERTYHVMGADKAVGQVKVRYTPHNKNVFIHWIGKAVEGVGAGDITKRIPMGPKNLRLMLGQLAKEFPNAETVSGLRNSGARTARGGEAASTMMPLKPYRVPPKPVSETLAPVRPQTPYTMSENEHGVIQLHFHLGKKAGSGGYMNQKVAELAAVRRGFSLRDVSVIESNSQWFIRLTHNVPETGVAHPVLEAPDMPNVNTFTQWWKNPQNSIPSMMNDARLTSTLERGNIESNVYQPLQSVIDKMSSSQVRRVTNIITQGQAERKWYNLDEFVVKYENQHKRLPTDKEIAGYYAFKEMNDANESLLSNYLYVDNVRKGYVTGSVTNPPTKFSLPHQNMRQIDKPDMAKTIIYDVENDTFSHPGTTLTDAARHEELKTRYESGNYRVFELQQHVMRDGDPVKYVMVHKRSSTIGPLEHRQRRYTPGGVAENRDKWMVKQSVRGAFKGTDTTYALDPLVHISDRLFTRATEWAKPMEEARLAFNGEGKYAAATALERRAVVESSGVESWEKWEQLVKNGGIRSDTPFEVLWDRQLPSDMDRLRADTHDWTPKDTSGASQYFLSNGDYYWQTPKEKLLDSQGAATRVLDPMKSVSRAANNAMSTTAFADYNRKVIEEWARVADPFIEERSIGFNHDPYNVFFNGDFNTALLDKNHKLYGQLEGQRLIHRRFLNMKTEKMSLRDLANRKIIAMVEGKGKLGDKIATVVYDMRSKNPVDAIQGFVFDSYLGFYDPGQFFVQAQTALAAITVHPLHGAKSSAMLLPMTHMLLNYSDSLLDMYAKSLKFIHGLPVDEFKAMVKNLRASGWMKVQGSLLQLDHLTNRVGGSTLGRGYSTLRQGGRYLFNAAERFNRLTAYQIAWNVAKKESPELHFSTAEFHSKVRMLTDDLTMNMTFASKAGWQKGLAGVPTKFMAYQAHMLENLLPKTFGGNPRLSGMQKTRLGVGQLLLYGTGGAGALNLTNYIMDSYETATGSKITPEMHRKVTKGFMDTLINSWSGGPGFWGDHDMAKNPGVLETDASQRIGVGAGIAQWMQKMSSGDLASALDVLGGPTGTEGTNMARAISRMAQYFRSEQVTKLTSEDWKLLSYDMFSSLKGVSRATKAYTIWKAGYLTDPKTGAPFVEAGEMDHWAAFLGIPLSKETEYWSDVNMLNTRKDIVRDYANQLVYRRRQAFKALEEEGVDSKKGLEWEKSANVIMGLMRDDPRMTQEVLDEANRLDHYNDNKYDTMMNNMEKATGRRSREGAN